LRLTSGGLMGDPKIIHRVDRCFLVWLRGDATNTVLAAAGANMRKLLRRFFYALIRWLEGTIVPITTPSIALKCAA